MSETIKFVGDYKVEGKPVVYKVDEEIIEFKRNEDGGFGWDMHFNMHVATEVELEEYKKR